MEKITSYPIEVLPASVIGDASLLSKDAKGKIKSLSGPRLLPFFISAFISWFSIAAFIIVAEQVNNIFFTIPILFLIATRQMALGYLLHEQAHYLAFKTKYGDLIANLLVCYPLLLITVDKYAQVHIAHHRHYFTNDDPDFNRKSGDEWAQPLPAKDLIVYFLKDLCGLNVLKLIKGKKTEQTPYPRRWPIPGWVRPMYLLLLLLVVTWFSVWDLFLIYWVLPLVTFFQVISRIGALCEHRYNLKACNLNDSTPLVILPWWQKLIVPDLNFGYHIYHHFFPGVSFSKLPMVHEIFQEEGLVEEENIYRGFFDYFRRAVISVK